jgi:hypothetical protein
MTAITSSSSFHPDGDLATIWLVGVGWVVVPCLDFDEFARSFFGFIEMEASLGFDCRVPAVIPLIIHFPLNTSRYLLSLSVQESRIGLFGHAWQQPHHFQIWKFPFCNLLVDSGYGANSPSDSTHGCNT